MPWLAHPYDNERFKFGDKYKIRSMPTLLIMNDDGTIADREGKNHVFKYANNP